MKKLIIILTLPLIYLFSINKITYYFISPYINFENIKILNPTINKINNSVNNVLKKEKETKLNFINQYGSNFVKENNIPNNLVQEINFDLGEYKFDGTNKHEIAVDINSKINSLKYNIYRELNKNSDFHIDTALPEYLQNVENNIEIIENQLSEHKKRLELIGSKEKERYYIANTDEIYIRDIPLNIYTKYKSGKNTKKVYRNIYIPIGYSFKLNDIINKKSYELQIVPVCDYMIKANLDIRLFAPSIFSNINNIVLLNSINNSEENEKYINSRITSITEHLESLNGYILSKNYIKTTKRLLQLYYLAKPLLNKQQEIEINEILIKNLNSKIFILLNEYKTIFELTLDIAKNENLKKEISYSELYKSNFRELKKILKKIKRLNFLDKNEYRILQTSLQKLDKKIIDLYKSPIITEQEYNELTNLRRETNQLINYISLKNIYKITTINNYIKYFYKILHKLGYYEFYIAILDKNTIGIVENSIPNNIDFFKLKKSLELYGLKDIHLKIIKDTEDIEHIYYKKIWLNMENLSDKDKNIFLEEKNNYCLKNKSFYIRRGL